MWVLKDKYGNYLGKDLDTTNQLKDAMRFYSSKIANNVRINLALCYHDDGSEIYSEFKLQGIKEVEA